MKPRPFLSRARAALAVFRAARAAAAATEAGRAPDARTLATLGIDPAQFRRIRSL